MTRPNLESFAGSAVTVENVSTGSWATVLSRPTSKGLFAGKGSGAHGTETTGVLTGSGIVGSESIVGGFTYAITSPLSPERTALAWRERAATEFWTASATLGTSGGEACQRGSSFLRTFSSGPYGLSASFIPDWQRFAQAPAGDSTGKRQHRQATAPAGERDPSAVPDLKPENILSAERRGGPPVASGPRDTREPHGGKPAASATSACSMMVMVMVAATALGCTIATPVVKLVSSQVRVSVVEKALESGTTARSVTRSATIADILT